MLRILIVVVLFLLYSHIAFSYIEKEMIWDYNKIGLIENTISPVNYVGVGNILQPNNLYDLLTGTLIFKADTNENIITDYSGIKFFVSDVYNKTLAVYDRYTTQFIQNLTYRKYSRCRALSDSVMFEFDSHNQILKFWNIYNDNLINSFDLFQAKNQPKVLFSEIYDFSFDGRFVRMEVNKSWPNYYVFDTKQNEFITELTHTMQSEHSVFRFFNHSNKILYSENIKLNDDTLKYPYLRIYDLETKEFTKNINVDRNNRQDGVTYVIVKNDDKFILYHLEQDFFVTNTHYLYNIEEDKLLDETISLDVMVLYFSDSIIVCMGNVGYRMLSPSGIDNSISTDDLRLYPNPSSDIISVQPSEGFELSESYSVQIFNTLGIDVSPAGGGVSRADGGGFRIDISHLPAGVYYIKIGDRVENFVKM